MIDRKLTGHVELSSQEPADPPAAQVAIPDPVERFHPAEPVGGGGPPEPIRVRDGEAVQVPVGEPGQLGAPGPGGRSVRLVGQTPTGSRSPAAAQRGPEEPGPPAARGHGDPERSAVRPEHLRSSEPAPRPSHPSGVSRCSRYGGTVVPSFGAPASVMNIIIPEV